MRRLRVCLLFLTLTIAALASPAVATVGGPELSTLLGYEARTGKIYFETTSHSEGPGTFIYSIPADSIGRVPSEPWPTSRAVLPNDLNALEQWTKSTLDSLRAALVQPDTLPRSRARLVSRVVAARTFRTGDDYFRRPEFEIQVDISVLALSGHTVITGFCAPAVTLGEIFLLPGGTRAVARVIYVGLPYETCYDADTFVLLTLKRHPDQ